MLSDRDLHDVMLKQSVVSTDVNEQTHTYLSETTISCIMALSSNTPGLDPHSVGCLIRTLRLCRITPEITKNSRKPSKTSENSQEFFDSLPNMFPRSESPISPRKFDVKFAEKEESNDLIITQLRDAVAFNSSKFSRGRSSTITVDVLASLSAALLSSHSSKNNVAEDDDDDDDVDGNNNNNSSNNNSSRSNSYSNNSNNSNNNSISNINNNSTSNMSARRFSQTNLTTNKCEERMEENKGKRAPYGSPLFFKLLISCILKIEELFPTYHCPELF